MFGYLKGQPLPVNNITELGKRGLVSIIDPLNIRLSITIKYVAKNHVLGNYAHKLFYQEDHFPSEPPKCKSLLLDILVFAVPFSSTSLSVFTLQTSAQMTTSDNVNHLMLTPSPENNKFRSLKFITCNLPRLPFHSSWLSSVDIEMYEQWHRSVYSYRNIIFILLIKR